MNNENWYKLLQQLDVSIDKNKYSRTKDKISLSAKHGFLMHAIPKQVGGYGNKFIDLYNAHRVLGYETQDTSLILSLNAHIWGTLFPILMFGNEQQKDTFFKDLLTGKAIGGHAITEPTAGSDSASILSTAVPTQKGYILNGHKKYITNSPISDLIIVYAKIEKALSAFIVLKEDIGIKFSSTCNVSCFPESPIGEIILENCLIPNDRLLGRIGIGTTIIQKALELERSFLFAGILGVMQWQLEQVISYSRSRVINKKLLRDYKNISHKIAEMSLGIESIKLWLEKCATAKDEGKNISLISAYTKLFASEEFLKQSQNSIQILGANGLEKSNIFSQLVLDGLGGRLLSGSSEIQKNIINGLLGSGKQ